MRNEEWWPASAPCCSYMDGCIYHRVRFYKLADFDAASASL